MSSILTRIRQMEVSAIVLGICLLLFPLTNLIYAFYPVSFMGKNAWLAIVTIAIVTSYFTVLLPDFWRGGYFPRQFFELVLIGMFGCIIIALRNTIFSESGSLLDSRYIVVGLLYFLFARHAINNNKTANSIGYVLILSALLLASIVIINKHFFPNVVLVTGPDISNIGINLEGFRTRDGLLGSSISANQIVCGIFALVVVGNFNSNKLYVRMLLYSVLLVLCYGVTLSGSRYPQFIAGILALSSFHFLFLSRQGIITFTVLIGVVIVVMNLTGDIDLSSNFRFNEDSGGRLDKLYLPAVLLTSSITNFLVGAPSVETESAISVEGNTISDNSYMLVALQLGVPFAVIYYAILIKLLKEKLSNKLSLFFFLYMAVGFGLTNCILWDSWFLIAITTSLVSSRASS